MNLDIKKSGKFIFGNLISDIYKAKAINKDELTVAVDKTNAINYITRTGENNGCELLADIRDIDEKFIEKGNAISIGDTTATCFYQPENFITGDHIVIVRADSWLNQYTALYIVTLLTNEQYKYSYGRAFLLDRIKNTILNLPIRQNVDGTPFIDVHKKYSDDGYVPDWKFMENYIKSLHYKPMTTKKHLCDVLDFDISSWKEFQIEKLFKISRGKTLSSKNKEEFLGNDYSCINGGSSDNGELCKMSKELQNVGFVLQKVPSLSLSRVGNAGLTFLQTKPYYIADNAFSLILKQQKNKFVYLFLSTCLNKELFKYSYGITISSEKYMKTIIKLPVKYNRDGTIFIEDKCRYSKEGYVPDWEFMENYIKSLPYGDRL